MIGASPRAVRDRDPSAPGDALFKPGRNCWRVEHAHRFSCVQDGADYFRLVRQALLDARDTVFMLGWDIAAAVDLLPGAVAPGAPTRLDQLLAYVVHRRPRLRCYILIWDYAALYTLERDPLSRWRLGWRMPRRVRFGFDDRHPVGASHHQKVVVIDDRLAFCGGIDLTGHRWDTAAHRVEEPARTTPLGEAYGPYHEIQAMVTGPVAASLGALARDRWRALGEEGMPPLATSTDDRWPSEVEADLENVDVAIARTVPGSGNEPPVRECEALFLDSIARARRAIYIESQYFTNDTLGRALAARLQEPDGPEIIVVAPRQCEGWLERNTMGAFRERVFRELNSADTHERLRLVHPMASRSRDVPTFVHSKVMIVDDGLVRIGSANFSRRSMGVDTECDLAVDAGDSPRARAGVRHVRNRLLAEHLGLPVDEVAHRLVNAGSLGALIDERARAEHTLVRIEAAPDRESAAPAALQLAADPDEPIWFGAPVAHLVPPADATNGLRPFRMPSGRAIVFIAAVASASSAVIVRPEFRAVQEALEAVSRLPSSLWIGTVAFVLGSVVLIPLELLAIAAGLAFGASGGGLVTISGSLAAAVIGYLAGRAIGAANIGRWMSRRSYRSARQLGARGVMGVLALRMASVASAGAIHLLCGAGRVPFATYMAGTVAGLVPAAAVLTGLGALLRHTLLNPSMTNAAITVGAALLLIAFAAALRTWLLVRQFAPAVHGQRERAEFG
jgi:phosphatidylserine/phosphatidylglycerophosphate/cardiolipin synthase-like enzyme/uncharacterized membrane protein YdjX (TVP38/TMEM64 family)